MVVIYEKVEFKANCIKSDSNLFHFDKSKNPFNELLCAKNKII